MMHACRMIWRGALAALLVATACVESTVPAPTITTIEPSAVQTGVETAAVVTGRHFYAKANSRLDADRPPTLDANFTVLFVRGTTSVPATATFVDTETLAVVVPATLRSGLYDVVVVTPTGRRATLPEGLRAVGSPTHIVLEDEPGGVGHPMTNLELTCDDELTLHAVSRDADGEFVADAEVEWTLVGNPVGILGTEPASSTTLELNRPGFSAVEAIHPTLGTARTVLDVTAGALARVLVTRQPGGAMLTGANIVVGAALEVHASGYDSDDNYLGLATVVWSLTHPIGDLTPVGPASSTLFTAQTVGNGQVVATPASGEPGLSGTLRVIPGAPIAVVIVDAPGSAAPVASAELIAGEERTFHAVAVDDGGHWVASAEVVWSWGGGCAPFAPLPSAASSAVTIGAAVAGSCTLGLEHAILLDDATLALTVVPGPLARLVIADSGGLPVGTPTMTSGQTLALFAAGYDVADNSLGAIEVGWAVGGGIGELSVQTGTATQLTATLAGAGQVSADVLVLAGAPDAATGTITVTPGPAVRLSIEDAPNGSGQAIDDLLVLIGTDTPLYAVARDAAGNAHVGSCADVQWSATDLPAGSSLNAGADGCLATLQAGSNPGLGTVTIHDPALGSAADDTIQVTVSDAGVARVLVTADRAVCQQWPGGTRTTDQPITLYAIGCDAVDVKVADLSVNWSLTSAAVGTLVPAEGTSTQFDPRRPGTTRVQAHHNTFGTAESGLVTVIGGALARVVIETQAGGNGNEVGAVSLIAGESHTWYAVGRDQDGNALGTEEVAWSVLGGIGTVAPTSSPSTTFTATTVKAIPGRVRADHATVSDDDTGDITVAPGPTSVLHLETAASGTGALIGSLDLNADQTRTLYAVGRDSYLNFTEDLIADWSVTGGVGILSPAHGSSTVFSANTAGSGMIVAVSGGLEAKVNPVRVTHGALARIVIEYFPGDPLDAIGAVTLAVGQSLAMAAVGRDTDFNYHSDLEASWSISGGIGSLSTVGPASQTIFTAETAGLGRVRADVNSTTELWDETGDLTVTETSLCNNHVIDKDEVCDGANLDGQTCLSRGYLTGTGSGLACAVDCKSFVTAGCIGGKIDNVMRIRQAVAEAYGSNLHQIVAIQPGEYTLSMPLVLNECPVPPCLSPNNGLTLATLSGGVTLTASCSVSGEFFLIEIWTGKQVVFGLQLQPCAGAVWVKPGADRVVISHNLITPKASAPTAQLVLLQGNLGLVEANRFAVAAATPVRYAIAVGSTTGEGASTTGNQVAMNVISGAMVAGIRVAQSLGLPPMSLDHNSIRLTGSSGSEGPFGIHLEEVAGLCYRNNIVVNSSIVFNAAALNLYNVTLGGDPCGSTNAGRNVARSSSGMKCSGGACADLCGQFMVPMCDIDADPLWSSELCLGSSATPLIDMGFHLGLDMVDDGPSGVFFLGEGPEVGAREKSGQRYFGGMLNVCN